MNTLDVETAPTEGDLSNGYALEPWRVRQGKARIESIAVLREDGTLLQIQRPTREQLIEVLMGLAGKEVVCHNALFDIAWLIASINPNKLDRLPPCITKIRWRDSMLLGKWVTNGRLADDMKFSYSLLNMCSAFLKDREGLDQFIAIKQGQTLKADDPYWLKRNVLDVEWTQALYSFLWPRLPMSAHRGFIIEQRALPQMANSWLIGMTVNRDKLKIAEDTLADIIAKGCEELGLTPDIIGSPAQLGRVVFDQWGFQPVSLTPNGARSTKADDFIELAYASGDQRLRKVLEIKQAITLTSKYVKTAYEALARTGDGCLYGVPRLFGTTSGRLTYSSETLGTFKVSIAQHQIPRKDKLIRAYLCQPDGSYLHEEDAGAQESRIMGIWSRDSEIIRVFNSGLNFHTNMACHIYGRAYEELQDAYKREDFTANEQRQMGKLTNLSCNFRIGGPKLAKKALTEYDTYMTEQEGRKLTRTFRELYPGVPKYWDAIINFAKENGFSYTLAQRRWKVPVEMLQSGEEAWKVEGTIISHPIQGTGGDMFYASLSQVPDARIITTMHDATFFAVDNQEEADYINAKLNATPYEDLWQLEEKLPIPLVYEASRLGTSFADVK